MVLSIFSMHFFTALNGDSSQGRGDNPPFGVPCKQKFAEANQATYLTAKVIDNLSVVSKHQVYRSSQVTDRKFEVTVIDTKWK